ncbi:MAG: hypothetical protein EA390_02705 [Balneolaceae bacterium]|nr:MAG: hypothetical protein EA390_02705 [Balneolaceae bacterium]
MFTTRNFLLFISLFILCTLPACGEESVTAPGDNGENDETVIVERGGHTEWSYNLAMYEVNIRQYTEEGTFSAFAEHLDRLEEMGVGILWLMPIHPIGEVNRLGTLGSYYSVKDYKDVNPEFGTLEDFANLVDEAQSRGMYVLLDWVPNHTSWDNYLTEEHPEFYVTDNNGNFTNPPGTNWSDVIQLDHSNSELLDYMVEAKRFWIEEYGIDGFRVDAVSFVDDDFQEQLNNEIRAIKPDIFILAEDDGPKWYDLGYDMSHGWGLYGFGHGVLIDIADSDANANDLYSYTQDQISDYPPENYRLYFTQNHDENSWYGTSSELFGDAAELFKVLTGTFYGMPLIYSGQEAGLDHRLQFFEKDLIEWQEHPNEELYTTLLHLKRENSALWNGEFGGVPERVSTTHDDDIFAFVRENNGEKVFVALNLSGLEVTFSLTGNVEDEEWQDLFSEDTILLQEGDEFSVAGWGYMVYEMR